MTSFKVKFLHAYRGHICHGRKSNLVEFQILVVESPIGVSTGRKSNYQHKLGRKSNWSFYW